MSETAATEGLRTTLAELPTHVGTHLGFTPWREMTQEEVDRFAELTGDHNFIHVDPGRAAATPFGGTIAHGFFGLSLVAVAAQQVEVTDAATSVNYGLDKVRFPAPLPVGAQWRAGAELIEVNEIPGGMQAKVHATVEVRDAERPAVAADCIVRFYA
ncbi:MAG TPA: MaoC family dehydratase [Solirubrobacteraceae bacterium]|nr:MaoC family dehydratase [Solirubrobacteraceae bacterium]